MPETVCVTICGTFHADIRTENERLAKLCVGCDQGGYSYLSSGQSHEFMSINNKRSQTGCSSGFSPMRMIFLIQKAAWFVEHQQAWYRLCDIKEVKMGLGGLALNIVNQHELIEQPHHAGSAHISQHDERFLRVTLEAPDKVLIDSIDVPLDQNALMNVDWNTTQFRDGWLSADAQVTLENVGSMFVDAYLPARAGSQGKMLTIADTESGNFREIWLARDTKTRVSVVDSGHDGKVYLKLSCEPESIDQSTDPRQLGFVLVSEEVRPV